jgi:hypothetical protein
MRLISVARNSHLTECTSTNSLFRTTLPWVAALTVLMIPATSCRHPTATTEGTSTTGTTRTTPTASPTAKTATPPAEATSTAVIWRPSSATPIHWQWQIGTEFDPSTDVIPNVTVYDIDVFDTTAAVVAQLHSQGCKVIGYFSAGSYEDWRPDASQFPSEAIGKSNGWPGEKWVDVRSDAVRRVMAARLDLAKLKGFDAVEPDCIDGYSNDTGFPLTAQDQLDYNRWIADQSHQRGLSVGLKNDVEQAAELEPSFDWALNEESWKYDEYSELSVFTNSNKAVFEVEYGQTTPQADTMNSLHFNSMTRDLNLVSPSNQDYVRIPCVPDTQDSWTK